MIKITAIACDLCGVIIPGEEEIGTIRKFMKDEYISIQFCVRQGGFSVDNFDFCDVCWRRNHIGEAIKAFIRAIEIKVSQ